MGMPSLQLLCHLKQGPMDLASLMEGTGFSQSLSSRQLGQLQRYGLVQSRPRSISPINPSPEIRAMHQSCSSVIFTLGLYPMPSIRSRSVP